MSAFTSDWTTRNFEFWRRILAPLVERSVVLLEVGSWEGRSALFFLDYLPFSTITCVDSFMVEREYDPALAVNVEARFDANLAPFRDRLTKRKGRSASELARLLNERKMFDVIYIDGSHLADDVLIDSALCWPMLCKGGLLIWDDYRRRTRDSPRQAIDPFLIMHRGSYELLHDDYQLIIRRTTDAPPAGKGSVRRLLMRWI